MNLPHHEKGRHFNKNLPAGAGEIPSKFKTSAHFPTLANQHDKPMG
ncbi:MULTISPECIES: hypothetical protein [Chromobacterium]|nr:MULTISPECIES: hypothetical protein [Chromobacterium]